MTHLKILKEVNNFLGANQNNFTFLIDGNIEERVVNFSMQGKFEDITFAFTTIVQARPDLVPMLEKAIELVKTQETSATVIE